jgi:hypothetical protein
VKIYDFDSKFIANTKIFKAEHKITTRQDLSLIFTAKIIQVLNKNFHYVEVFKDPKCLLAVSKLIGFESLPNKTITKSRITLDYDERAMIVENSKCDYFILIGKRNKRNNLMFKIHTNQKSFDPIEVFEYKPMKLTLMGVDVVVDFSKSLIDINSKSVCQTTFVDFASIIALVFSTIVLRYLLR